MKETIYYTSGMELEVISQRFCGKVNDVSICRDRLSASGALYLVLLIHDRTCARKFLSVAEESFRRECSPCVTYFAQNEELLFVFHYRDERKFSSFVKGQMTSPVVGEAIAVNLVMECMSCGLPWPLLDLVLNQDCIHITKENEIYFSMDIDLAELRPNCTERTCISSCAQIILNLLDGTSAGRRRGKKRLDSFELIRKKSAKSAYQAFRELYRDIRLTSLPQEKPKLVNRVRGVWNRNRDRLFRFLLVICVILLIVALAMLVTQLIFGDIPWLRLFQNGFDRIGTENLHIGGGQ